LTILTLKCTSHGYTYCPHEVDLRIDKNLIIISIVTKMTVDAIKIQIYNMLYCLSVVVVVYFVDASRYLEPSAVIARVQNKNVVSWQTRNNRKLPKHKLSQNAQNLQCLLKLGLIEDNVNVFQWSWNSALG